MTLEVKQIPRGYCQCGCGEQTKPAPATRKNRGWVRGEPLPFAPYHGRIIPFETRYVVEDRGYITPCWVWQGCTVNGQNRPGPGYGILTLRHQKLLAHRFAYERYVGPIPEGLQIDHLCYVTNCVNPEHMEPVTAAENVRRRRWHGPRKKKGVAA